MGFPGTSRSPPSLSTCRRCVPSASVSFDTLALDSLHLHVFRHVGTGFPPPPCLSTRRHCASPQPPCLSTCWRWVSPQPPCLSTRWHWVSPQPPCLSTGWRWVSPQPPCLSTGWRWVSPQPPCTSTCWRWDPYASASFDTSALCFLRLSVFRRLGIGPHHVGAGFPPPPCSPPRWCWAPFVSAVGQLAAPSFGSRWACCAGGHMVIGGLRRGVGLPCDPVVWLVVMGNGWLGDMAWVCRGRRVLISQ